MSTSTSPAAVEIRLVSGQAVVIAPNAVARIECADKRRGLTCSRVHFGSGLIDYVVGDPREIAERLFGDGFAPLVETDERRAEVEAAEARKPAGTGNGTAVNRRFDNTNETEGADAEVLV